MARWPARTTLEVGAQRDPQTGRWYFVIVGAHRRVMHEGKPVYDSDEEARAAARDWLVQTMLR